MKLTFLLVPTALLTAAAVYGSWSPGNLGPAKCKKNATTPVSQLCDDDDAIAVPGTVPAIVADTDKIVPGKVVFNDNNIPGGGEMFADADVALQLDIFPAEEVSAALFTDPGLEIEILSPAGVTFSSIKESEKANYVVYQVCNGGVWEPISGTAGATTATRMRLYRDQDNLLLVREGSSTAADGLTFRLGMRYGSLDPQVDEVTLRITAFAGSVIESSRSKAWEISEFNWNPTAPEIVHGSNGRLIEVP